MVLQEPEENLQDAILKNKLDSLIQEVYKKIVSEKDVFNPVQYILVHHEMRRNLLLHPKADLFLNNRVIEPEERIFGIPLHPTQILQPDEIALVSQCSGPSCLEYTEPDHYFKKHFVIIKNLRQD